LDSTCRPCRPIETCEVRRIKSAAKTTHSASRRHTIVHFRRLAERDSG
jgi:hypothetical protein